MYMISVPIYMVSHVNPVWIFKVMGPILYGSMIFALFRFLRLGLEWNPRQALGGALLTSLYFVSLRVSWDLYRNMLGLTFILLTLVFLRDHKGLRNRGLLALSIIGAVAADQLTGVIVLFLVAARVLREIMEGHRTQFKDLVFAATPGIALFLSILYVDLGVLGNSLGQRQPALPELQSISNSMGFLGFAFLPLVPLVAIGVRKVSNLELRGWSFFCVAAAVTTLMPFVGLNVPSYRWSLLMSIPLCVFAAAGLARLTSVQLNVGPRRWLQIKILPIFSIIIVSSAILYIALPAQQAMPYYVAYSGLLTTSMIQDTVPLSDMGHLHELLDWVSTRSGPGTVLITHQAIYGWARAYESSEPIINYEYSSPLEGVEIAKGLGYSSILMIWWVNGRGWHGQPTVPIGFVQVASDGDMAVYEYN
jgi:hypothetical protein